MSLYLSTRLLSPGYKHVREPTIETSKGLSVGLKERLVRLTESSFDQADAG